MSFVEKDDISAAESDFDSFIYLPMITQSNLDLADSVTVGHALYGLESTGLTSTWIKKKPRYVMFLCPSYLFLIISNRRSTWKRMTIVLQTWQVTERHLSGCVFRFSRSSPW